MIKHSVHYLFNHYACFEIHVVSAPFYSGAGAVNVEIRVEFKTIMTICLI